ncbi:hypothetical protein JXC34_01870, partial [Candidatus Woesearchaeota archaeon]|nr:hypothetical protein [Candidatus Woesearchaeota archaeon]
MQFGTGYYGPMDREYEQINLDSYPSLEEPIEKEPVVGVSEMGISVTEGGRFGPLGQSVQAAIRLGAGRMELATGMGGGQEPVGAESYGKEAREELRELAMANEISYTSVHAPVQIGNLSGYNSQQGTFSDEMRAQGLEEIKSAIRFAGDAAQGGAVVVHTGEFARPISGRWDSDHYQFVGYPEEREKAVAQMVDDRTGQILMQVRKSQIVHTPLWLKSDKESYVDERGNRVEKGDYVDYEGRKVDEANRVPVYDDDPSSPNYGRFKVQARRWEDFENEATQKNIDKELEYGRGLRPNEVTKPEELFLREQVRSNIDQARGWSLYHMQRFSENNKDLEKLKEAKKFWDKVESETDEEEKWRLKQQFKDRFGGLVPAEAQYPSQFLNDTINELRKQIEHTHQSAVSYEQQAKEQQEILKHAKPVERYAIDRSLNSYAEAGITAMKETKTNPHIKRDIF